MATNKERIETNNTRLNAISTQLDDLPPKVNLDATTITPGIENQVISSGTYLNGDLTVLGDADLVADNIKDGVNIFGVDGSFDNSHGEYVWKKLTKPIMVTFVQTSYNPITLTVSSSNIDLGTVDESWFVGIKCSYSWATAVYAFEFMENNVFVIWTADGKSHLYEGTYSYNPSNKTITTDINTSGSFGINSSATKQENFLDFVVSDSPTAYPDGGEQGGYWYEKVVEGKAGIDFGELTLSGSHEGNLVVTHNLGVKPSKAFIFLRRNSIGCGSPGDYTAGADSTGAYQNYSFTGDKDWLYRTQQSHIMAASTVTFKQATTYWSSGTYDWVVIK